MRLQHITILTVIALLCLSGVSFGQGLGMYFVHPASDNSDQATTGTFTIEWANPDPTWTYFNLYYIQFGFPGAQQQPITTTPVPVIMMTYTWNTSAVPDGQYNIVAQVTNQDGSMPGQEQTSEGHVTVSNGAQQNFVFIHPGSNNESPGANGIFTIEWSSTLLGSSLILYYDDVPQDDPEINGTRINFLEISIGTISTYSWDTTTVQPPGCYYIGAVIAEANTPNKQSLWSVGCVNIDNGVGPGTFRFLRPIANNEPADDFYEIQWATDLSGSLNLFYSNNNLTYNQADKVNPVPLAIPQLVTPQGFTWNTQNVPEGNYYIVAEVTQTGQGIMEPIYSTGTVQIDDKEFWFVAPPPQGANFMSYYGASYTIQWDSDFSVWPDPSLDQTKLTVNLFYDTNTDSVSGLTPIRSDLPLLDNQFRWTVGSVTGKIYIYGEVWKPGGDPANPMGGPPQLLLSNYSGPLTITQGPPQDLIMLAPSTMNEIADSFFEVKYIAFKEGELVLFKDKDAVQGGTSQISVPIQISTAAGNLNVEQTYVWSTNGEQNGSIWYISGSLRYAGTTNSFTAYSQGTVLIQNEPDTDKVPPGTPELYALPISSNPNAIELRWIAPADDGNTEDSGPASQYDIRYSLNEKIQDEDWNTYSQVPNIEKPLAPGEDEELIVGGFNEHTTVYFAMKAADEVPNWSGMSNIATAKTVPVSLTEFYAVSGDYLITLYWTTATERDNLGFNILRKTDDSREYIKVNSRLIQGAGTSSREHSYSYEDNDVSPGVLYYYILESVSTDGVIEHSEPITAGIRVDASNIRPVILWGGYFETDVTNARGGNFTLKASVESRYPIETVELLYRGIPTRIFLNDEGINGDERAGDKIYTFKVDMEPGIERGQYLIELKAIDTNGNESSVFPYLTVR